LAAAERAALPVARGDVVGAGVTEHVVEGVLAGDVLATFPDHDGQFALEIHFSAGEVSRQLDRVAGVLQRAGGLHEKHGHFRGAAATFGGVLHVVEADGQDARRHDRREAFTRCDGLRGELKRSE